MHKGMSMAMQLLITAIVLVATGLTVLLIVQNNLVGKTGEAEEEGNVNFCVNARNTYCQDNQCWDASRISSGGTTCDTILQELPEVPDDRYLYNCQENEWYSSQQQQQIKTDQMDVECGTSRTG